MNRTVRAILVLLVATAGPVAGAEGEGNGAGKPVPPHEVFQLRVEDQKLVLRTALPPTPAEEIQSLTLAGVGGTAELTNAGAGGAHEPGRAVVPSAFRLEISDNDAPGERVGVLVSWHDGTLDVQRSVHYTGEHRYTRLTRLLASADPAAGAGPSVQLMVNESGNVGREPLRVYARGRDFFALLREHPEEAGAHLRPLLRELGQEAVFAPEPQVAWQVFADRWTPDAKLKRQVEDLLPKLDAPDEPARQAATREVGELGQEAVLVLLQLDRATLSAEQNSRVDVLIAGFAPLPPGEAARLRGDVSFLLDCLNSDDPRVRTAALERLRDAVPQPVEFDTALEVPARGAAVARLREALVPS